MSEYDKKQSTWNEKRTTMIRKVALVQALREAFPTQLGAMYTQEEQNVKDTDFIDISNREVKQEVINQDEPQEEIQPEQVSDDKSKKVLL